ncbi:hypothetical protein PI95_028115 [Hassallia byssoidea VB512170]|uniref:Uncharacterized protein n=1 Tax=Hassallia byssoidea VB512170 TaxID=1304833 RepID=A0A846HHJ3_9CYAN|nr:hypothetical protein [Hassalia byssoidea VB512170]
MGRGGRQGRQGRWGRQGRRGGKLPLVPLGLNPDKNGQASPSPDAKREHPL